MPFWNSEKLLSELRDGRLISPCSSARVKQGAYELALGKEVYISSADKKVKQRLGNKEQIIIPPGQLALLLTEEHISMPRDTIGFISIRARIKFRGLVNISGFHVDPGFVGKLKFSVYNAGAKDIILAQGDRLFPIWFCTMTEPTKDGQHYNGDHLNQEGITSEDVALMQGELASPAELKRQLDGLRTELLNRIEVTAHTVAVWRNITIGLLVAAIPAAFGAGIQILNQLNALPSTPASPKPVATSPWATNSSTSHATAPNVPAQTSSSSVPSSAATSGFVSTPATSGP